MVRKAKRGSLNPLFPYRMKNIILLIVFTLFTSNTFSQTFQFSNNHLALLVKDIDKSSQFYDEILQLKKIETPVGMSDTVRWFALSDGIQIHLTESDEKIRIPKGINISISTDQLVDFVNLLITKKIPFEDWFGEEKTTTTRSDGVKLIYLQDPDGYWIEVNNDTK